VRVIVPFAGELNPVVRDVLEDQAIVDFRRLTSDFDYHNLLRSIWIIREPVILIEHDVLPWPGALAELAQCSCAWGANSYKLHGGIGIYHGFGCTKLTPELMAAVPDIWECDPIHWSLLDQRLWFAAREKGYEPHPHRPPVIHLSKKHVGPRADI
jgi:hypothetical protein